MIFEIQAEGITIVWNEIKKLFDNTESSVRGYV